MYSAWSWAFPALTVAVALVTEHGFLSGHFSPGYGLQNCWFHNANALLVFVVAPLAVVMALNTVFFVWSAYLIYSTTSETENTSNTHTDFRLYIRLAFIMGLTWVTGLIAGYLDSTGKGTKSIWDSSVV
jgi:energy-coupling factor transporter transmembrane protein EcfT